MKARWLGGVVCALLLVATRGLEAQELKRVRAGHFVTAATAGLYVAQDRGYFAEQGIKLEAEAITEASKAYTLMAMGEMDLYAGGPVPSLFNAIATGISLKLVADKAHEKEGYDNKALIARKDLYDSGKLRSVKDIKGMSVASLPAGTSMDYQLDLVLRPNGLSLKDIKFVGMPMPDALPALKTKRVDAAWVFEPILTMIVQQGLGVKLTTLDKWAAGLQGGAIIYGEAFTKRDPDLARRFMVAYVRGLRDYNDALKRKPIRKDVIESLIRWTPLKNPELYEKMVWGALDPDGKIYTKYLLDMQQWYFKEGQIKQIIPVERIVDHQYVEHAAKVLGRYE